MPSAAAQAGYPEDWVAYGQGGFAPPGMFPAGLGGTQAPAATPTPVPAPVGQSAAAAAGYPADWVPYGNGGFAPPTHPAVTAPTPAAPSQPAAPTSPTGPAAPAPVAPATPATIQQAFRDSIQATLGGPTPDQYAAQASTGPEANAYKTVAQRSAERQQRQAAHLNAIQGGAANSPQLAMASRGIEQQRGESEASFTANLVSQRLEAKRAELMRAWEIAASLGEGAETRALEQRIAEMNAAIERSRVDVSREGLDVQRAGQGIQRELGLGDLGLRGELGRGDLDLRRYGIDVGRETALDELGLGYSNLAYNARRDAIDRSIYG